jgi:Probable Zinc-ribbon domain
VSSLGDLHPTLAAQWHPTANAPLTPDAVAPSNGTRVTWRCPADPSHVWEAVIRARVFGRSGCPFCTGRRVTPESSLLARYPEIAKEWHPTRNGALGPGDVRYGSGRKVWWQCTRDPLHTWQAPVTNRTANGSGCPVCTGRVTTSQTSLLSLFPEIAEEWHPTKNGALGPADVRPGANRRVWWCCRRDPSHVWAAVVSSRAGSHKTGCPACSGRVATAARSLATMFPAIAAEWHPTRNGRVTPRDVMPYSGRKVWWLCAKDATHTWQGPVATRTHQGSGCPACANLVVTPASSLAAQFPAVAAEWHPTRNGPLRPADVVPGTQRKVWWQCSVHPGHVWCAAVDKRTRDGRGCPACVGKMVTEDNSLLARYPELSREWHPTKNGSLTPAGVTPGSDKSIWWRCAQSPAHEWRTSVGNRTRNRSGCPACYEESRKRRSLRGAERVEGDPALAPPRSAGPRR